jgi:L-serine dehydratase
MNSVPSQNIQPDATDGTSVPTPIGVFDLFKVGIGPSSSHTVGPMKAAAAFIEGLRERLNSVDRIKVTVFGSLAWTGKGHSTDKAIVLGLSGFNPETLDPDYSDTAFEAINARGTLSLGVQHDIKYDPGTDMIFDKATPCDHPNTMWFEAFDRSGSVLTKEIWLSLGGGFIARRGDEFRYNAHTTRVPFPFSSGNSLINIGHDVKLTIASIMLENETSQRCREAVEQGINRLADVMLACIDRGLAAEGELPGGMKVKRRARQIFEGLNSEKLNNVDSPSRAFEYVSAFAIAVNEENASGGRVVTAPTNGAAGVIPAVLRYYQDFCPSFNRPGIQTFFLAAAAIGSIIKRNASISGAEVGCQGEVGSAAAMAAAGLCAALGGSNEQVENAAEIAMEHHLGMTCDPIGGLVQIPCIERNAFGAVKAITAAALALRGDGKHFVSLDQVIETMRQTGEDMQSKYKETSRGGLAVNVIEC